MTGLCLQLYTDLAGRVFLTVHGALTSWRRLCWRVGLSDQSDDRRSGYLSQELYQQKSFKYMDTVYARNVLITTTGACILAVGLGHFG